MFVGFAAVWSPVAIARSVGRKPHPVSLAGERIVLFRDRRGAIAALIDRCPHRGVALSLGTVTEDGTLACPFHGWEFAADGACTHIALNDLAPDRRQRARAVALPVREIGGLIWIYTDPDAVDPPEPVVPDALTDARWQLWHFGEVWQCHWTRAMENMLDMPHVPFLHRKTIGRGMTRRLKRDSRMTTHVEPTDFGMTLTSTLDGQGSAASLNWYRPNGMALHISPPTSRFGLRQHLWCVPVDETQTLMLLVSARTFGKGNPLMRLFDLSNKMILHEDRRVVESSQPAIVPPPSEEMSVATDAPTLAFRRWYLQFRSDQTE
jgi:phenylpropionate dioxygenase-like ring-hydroxylating dioxygenase large terminal subunit